jgi:N-acetylglucosamine kinase-like BadF-type ATPase
VADYAIAEVVRASSAALAAAGAHARDLDAACFSLAGADWPEDFELLRSRLRELLGLRAEPLVVNDAIGPIRAATADGVGAAAISGTWGAAGARNARGEVFHLGFWPDGTGASALGPEGLAAVWRAGLGLGPETSLTARALERWRCADWLELLHELTRRGGVPRSERNLFSDAVLDEADAGDDVARCIVETAGTRLGDYARICAQHVGLLRCPFPLVLGGGVLRHPSRLLRESILSRVPGAEPVYPAVPPVAGALLLAADLAGARPSLNELSMLS